MMRTLCQIFISAIVLTGQMAPADEQVRIDIIERIPNHPQPYALRDWQTVAWEFDRLAFDLNRTGEHLPLVFLYDDGDLKGFGLPSYVGDYRRRQTGTRYNEAVATLGAVLGGTFVGIDKSAGPHNWVEMCRQHYVEAHGEGVILNDPTDRSAASYWYTLFPNILFLSIADRYPNEKQIQSISDRVTRRWLEAASILTKHGRRADFDSTAFDFRVMKPVTNGRWTEPDSGAALAWIMHAAYRRALSQGNDAEAGKYLEAVDWCLGYYQDRRENPAYEILTPFGVYTAARMNAEQGRRYDVAKLFAWCFERSDARPTMIMIADRWEGRDMHGLMGFTKPAASERGYAFTMNTFASAWPLVPLVRYDDRFARTVGKWMLGATNAARHFYPQAHPASRQTNPEWAGDPRNVVAYEGLRQKWMRLDEPLTAGGDPLSYDWGPETDLGIYGSSYVGVFGSIVQRTNHERILRLDLLATDTYRDAAYPTYLYFNPHDEPKDVSVELTDEPVDLYDSVSNRFLRRNVRGRAYVTLPADTTVVLVLTPSHGRLTHSGTQTLVGGVVIDYRND
jgi:hypothetical protein